METNKLILACLITLCSLPVAAQVETVQPAAGSNSIGAASARHAGTNDQFCLRQPDRKSTRLNSSH